jgi:G2/mitotic-specific cyclin-B, other
MRSILFDWIVDVHLKYQLREETLYLCRHLVDGFLTANSIERTQLQLLGITALFIASKYEEIYPPLLKDFVKITDDAYSKQDVLDMETQIMTHFNFDLFFTCPLMYLDTYCKAIDMDEKNRHLAWYFFILVSIS